MLRSILVLLAFAISATAAAEGLNYTYLQASYGQVEFDDFDVDGDGFGISGSFALTEQFFLFGTYEMADFDFDVEADTFDLGGGFHAPLADNIDVVATLAYVYTEVSSGFGSVDDNGYGIGVGLRALVSPKVELNGGVEYVDLSDSGSDTGFGAGFLFHINDMFSVGLSGSWNDDASAYSLGGRLNF
ncbi:MAG: outer membrane beta-barrel protein [Woeseiaceae bacterium]